MNAEICRRSKRLIAQLDANHFSRLQILRQAEGKKLQLLLMSSTPRPISRLIE